MKTASNIILRILAATRVLSLFDKLSLRFLEKAPGDILILLYHRVSPEESNWELPPIHPDVFDAQMKWLTRTYQPVSLRDCVAHITGTRPLPLNKKRYVAVTFDDGYLDNYKYAFPILDKYAVPATFFITTGLIEKTHLIWTTRVSYLLHNTKTSAISVDDVKYDLSTERARKDSYTAIINRYDNENEESLEKLLRTLRIECELTEPDGNGLFMSWEQILQIARGPLFTIGGHTVSHPNVATLRGERLLYEISESQRVLRDRLQTPTSVFAYPFGQKNHISDEGVTVVKGQGFTGAVTTIHGFNNHATNPYMLQRVTAPYTLAKLQLKVTKPYHWFLNLLAVKS